MTHHFTCSLTVLSSLAPRPLPVLWSQPIPSRLPSLHLLPHSDWLLERPAFTAPAAQPGSLGSPWVPHHPPRLVCNATHCLHCSSPVGSCSQVLSTTFHTPASPPEHHPLQGAWPPYHEKVTAPWWEAFPLLLPNSSPFPPLCGMALSAQPRNLDFVLRTMRNMESF